MRTWLISVCISFCVTVICAQTPVPDFLLPSSACQEQSVFIENLTQDAVRYEWEFCAGNLAQTPTATSFYSTSSFQNVNYLTYYKEGDNHYGFVVDRTNDKIYRLDFGTSVDNIPTLVDLGNLGQTLMQPIQLALFLEGGIAYGLLIDFESSSLFRLRFGASITNMAPSITNLGSLGALNGPIGISVLHDGTSVKALVTSFNSSKCTLLDFGSSIEMAPTVQQIELGVGTTRYRGISVINDQDTWYAFIGNDQTNNVRRLQFTGAITNSPVVTSINSIAGANTVQASYDGDLRYVFVQSLNGDLYRLFFSNGWGQPPVVSNLGKLGMLTSSSRGITLLRHDGKMSRGFVINSANSILKLTFSNTCASSLVYTEDDEPDAFRYSSPGIYDVILTAHSSTNRSIRLKKQVTVSASVSPDITISAVNNCANHDVNFESINSSGTITDYDWNFGDGNTSASDDPPHQYLTGGNYNVELEVTGSNGCKNTAYETVTIYDEPIADFEIPTGILCTNQRYFFTNTSVVDPLSPVLWEWSVNSVNQSDDIVLEYEFQNMLSHEIELKASIPGCESIVTKLISSISEGPLVDFSSVGFCQDSQINFVNNTTGDIISYQWDFDDGDGSTDTNPNHAFQSSGVFDVTLQASSTNGCQNSKTKAITIYSKPQADFLLALPPFSCSGSASQFTDVTPNPTDSNLDFWQWDFGDPESGQNSSNDQNPQHIYDNPGSYIVSLTVGTNFGCETTIQKPVTIAQSPTVAIINSPACQNVPIEFSADSDVPIKNWSWQMGTTSYYFENPTHLYSAPASYDVFLDVVGTNDCVASVSKVIDIFQPPTPDFVIQKNCVDQQTEFTDVTLTNGDPVASVNWNFGDGNTGAGTPVLHTFSTAGDRLVQLNVTTEGGCVYTGSKNVSILPAPVASFTASPEVGIPPLTVQFTNTSSGATAYTWEFNDPANTTSTQPAPSFTFVDEGNHVVELTVTNSQGCLSSTSKIIAVEIPVIDLAIETFVISESQDGVLTGNVQLQNNGNVTISNLLLTINLSGIQIQSIVTEPIPANASIAHPLNFNIIQTNALGYICVRADLDGDRNTFDNEKCVSSGDETFVFTPYPNPSTGTVMMGWIATERQPVTIKVYDPLGKLRLDNLYTSASGLTTANLNLEGMTSGVYLVVFDSGEAQQTFRIRLE